MATSKVDIWNMANFRVGGTRAIESEDENTLAASVCRAFWDNAIRTVLEARHWTWAKRQKVITEIVEQSQTTAYSASISATQFEVPFAFNDTSQLEVVRIASGGAETVLTPVTDYTITLAADGVNAYITLVSALTSGESVRRTVTTSRFGWDHVYAVPNDIVTPIALLYDDTRHWLTPVDGRMPFEIVLNEAGDGRLLCTDADIDADDFDTLEYIAMVTTPSAMTGHFIDALAWRLAVELALGVRKDQRLAADMRKAYLAAIDEAGAQSMNIGQDVTPKMITPSRLARG